MIQKTKIVALVRSKTVAILLSSLASCLMIIAPESIVTSCFGVLTSLVLLQNPVTFVPLIISASISSSFAVFGFLAAVFYYSFMMLVGLLYQSGFKVFFRKDKLLIFMALFFLWVALCSLQSGTLYLIVRIVTYLALLYLCASTGKLDYDEAIDTILFAAPLICGVCILKFLIDPVVYELEGSYFIWYRTTIVENLNPNQLAPPIALFAIVTLVSACKRNKYIHFVSFALAIILLSLIKSRTGFYSTVALSVISFLILFKAKTSTKLLSLGLVALIVLAGSSFGNKAKTGTLDEKTLDASSVIEDGGSGRFLTWAEAFTSIIPGNPVFGIGFGKASYERCGYDFDADNMYVDLLCESGIVGFIFFLIMFITLMRTVSSTPADSFLATMCLVLLLVYGLGETLFDSEMFWTIVFLSLVFIRSNGRDQVGMR